MPTSSSSPTKLTLSRRWAAANRGFLAGQLFFLTSLLYMLFSADFYVLLLKRADFINEYVIASNVARERELTDKLKEDFDFDAIYEEQEQIENRLLEAQEKHEAIYQEQEYKRLLAEQSYWEKTSFSEHRDEYETIEDFDAARKEKLDESNQQIKAIDIARVDGQIELKKIKEELRELKIQQMQIKTKLKVARQKSEKVISQQKGTFSAAVFEDLEVIGPRLADALNEYFYEGPVHDEIARAIDFFTDYESLKKKGYLSTDPDAGITSLYNEKLKIPAFRADLRVATGPGKTGEKKHLTAEVFTEIIKNESSLKNRQLLIDTFQFTQTNLFETFANDFSHDYNLSFQKNTITFRSIELTGAEAEFVKTLIQVLTFVRKYLFIIPLYAFLVLGFNFIGPHKKERLAISLKTPFLIMTILFSLIALFGAYGYNFLYADKHSFAIMATVHSAIAAANQFIFGIPALVFFMIYFWGRAMSKTLNTKNRERSL